MIFKVRDTVSGKVHEVKTSSRVDTVYEPGAVQVNSATVYPTTTLVRDQIWFRNDISGGSDSLTRGTLRITTSGGKVVLNQLERTWPTGAFYDLPWYARDEADQPLDPGRYWARIIGTDRAGNTGRSSALPVVVSGAALVEASGSSTVTPADSKLGPVVCGRFSGNDCGVWSPCGSVLASSAYAVPGALSYRSSTTCTDTAWHPHVAYAGHTMAPGEDAPRGFTSARVSMRGKPTVDGETDTAKLSIYGTAYADPAAVSSAAVTGESVTSTAFKAQPPGHPSTIPGIYWSVATSGEDSYDVASFTLDYTYLTPQG